MGLNQLNALIKKEKKLGLQASCYFQVISMPPIKGQMLIYSEEQMQRAIAEVQNGRSIASAAKMNKVPRSTLINKVKGISPQERRMGPDSVVTRDEERILVQWLFAIAKAGFPVGQCQLLDSVQALMKELKKKIPFTDDRPGRSWYNAFCKRNPTVSARIAQNLTASRAEVSKESLINWFKEVHSYLKEEGHDNILDNPSRVFDADEAAFFLNPKGN